MMAMEAGSGLQYSFPGMESDARLRELILYVSQKSSDDPRFGATKLNKILYFADFIAYRLHGKPITGAEYQRLSWGPAPKRLRPIRDRMVEDRELAVEERKFYEREQHRTVALRDPDIGVFSREEIALVDEIIRVLWEHTGSDVSRLSHTVAWEIVDDGESIPYEAAHLSPESLTQEDIDRARVVAADRAAALQTA